MRENKFMDALGKRGIVIGLILAMLCSVTHQGMVTYAETDPDFLDPDDEFVEEQAIIFKDKQRLTYSTLGTAKTIYDPTSTIEVDIEVEDNAKVSGKIVVPAYITYPKTGKKYKVIAGSLGFGDCKGMTSLVLPASWKEIPHLFCGRCENLKSVTLKASSIKLIDYAAFWSCHKLTTIKNIQKVKEIGSDAFRDCFSLKKLKLDQVVYIDDKAFQGCKKLKSITIGKKFKELGSFVFSRCKKLKTITIKSTKLKKVSKTAFKNTSQKITIKVPKKKLSAYKKLFKNKGNKKVVVKAA